jgi:hypothetical protein
LKVRELELTTVKAGEICDNDPIGVLPLPRPILRTLREGNLNTIGELCAYRAIYLRCWPNLARWQIGEIEDALARHGRRMN